jgi:nucleoside-diphosphate-sugar epimerase
MLEKILITGGTGFIGTYLYKEFVKLGHSPTIISRSLIDQSLLTSDTKGVEFVQLDLLDHEKASCFIAHFRPTLVINLAGTNRKDENNSDFIEKLNFSAAVNLFEAAREVRVKRLIQIGTADEYGSRETPQNETFELRPSTEYSLSKANATKYANEMFNKSAFPSVVLRPFTVYGAGQPSQMFLSQLIHCSLQNESFEMTDGFQRRDYVFIDDLISAIITACFQEGIDGEVFNIGSGVSFALSEIAKKVWSIIGSDIQLLRIGARKADESELYDTCADITKAKLMLKWHPKVPFDQGLNRTIEAMRKNLRENR